MSTLGAGTAARTPEDRARRRARYLSGLLWHAGAFLIINAFFWALDLTLGGGELDWAYWISGVWGIALAFHALAYFIDGRGLEEHKVEQYLGTAARHTADDE